MKKWNLKLLAAAVLACLITVLPAHASFHLYNASNRSLGILTDLKCGTGVTCTVTAGKGLMVVSAMTGDVIGDGGDQLFGFLQNQVVASTTALTAAQCGSSVLNAAAVVQPLPEASTVLGCRYTFITRFAGNFDVNPDDADKILVQTDTAGDATRNATLGNSLTIEACSASEWCVVGILGTWTDAN